MDVTIEISNPSLIHTHEKRRLRVDQDSPTPGSSCQPSAFRQMYYRLKPFIPRAMQIWVRKWMVRRRLASCGSCWPIDQQTCVLPDDWQEWPGGKKFALVLTHDVEGPQGFESFKQLVVMEEKLGFKSSFYFVPKKYNVDQATIDYLQIRGFEVGVHGWKHDGRLYSSRSKFERRARKINRCLTNWNAVGFRSPAMHHNLEWLHLLDIEYDLSTFDTDPFEPQPDGVGTIFPFWVGNQIPGKGYVEMPYTLPQDFTLFVLMGQRDIDTWVRKLRWVADIGGMALLCTHPDYMNFDGNRRKPHEYPATLYEEFLKHVQDHFPGCYWNALPCEMARFCRLRHFSLCRV